MATTTTGTVKRTTAKRKTVDTPHRPAGPDGMKRWATAGVALTGVLSAVLNGYAASQHSPAAWAGWGMGVTIPVIVLILARVAGLQWKRGQRRLAYAGAGVGTGLLLLSVWHCATSIAALMGGGVVLALPMAVAIDAGLVYCEVCGLVD